MGGPARVGAGPKEVELIDVGRMGERRSSFITGEIVHDHFHNDSDGDKEYKAKDT